MTLALNPAAFQRAIDLSRRGWKALPGALSQAREGARSAPKSVKITVRAFAFWFTVAFFLTWLGRFGTGAAIAGAISVAALLALGVMADFWRIGFRWHAQRVLHGWKALHPWARLWALPYRRMFVGTGIAFTAPTLYAGLRLASFGDSKRFVRSVRALKASGAIRVFRRDGLAFAAAIGPVDDADLAAVMSQLAEHGRRLGVTQVNRFLILPIDSALAALDNGSAFEYAEML